MNADWQMMKRLQRESPVPRLNSPLFPSFNTVSKRARRRDTNLPRSSERPGGAVTDQTGKIILPQVKDPGVLEWTTREKASAAWDARRIPYCYEKALELDPGCVSLV